jgi:hypothetical protein
MKSLFKSKTFWLAIGQAFAGGAGLMVSEDPTLHAISWGAVGKSLLDIGLRVATKQPVQIGG